MVFFDIDGTMISLDKEGISEKNCPFFEKT